ncbi:MAG: cupredoxin domain-containing protein [Actinomycetota bacterium]
MRAGRGFPFLVAVALSMGLVAAACAEEQPAVTAQGGGEDEAGGEEQQEEGSVTIAGQEATNRGSADVTGASQTDVELADFSFAPTVLEGEAGQALSVELSNSGMAPHTFTVDEQDVDVQLGAGESGQADVTFPESGALVFYCRFHVAGGMLGGLSVGGDLAAAAGAGGSGSGEDSEDQPSGPGY